MSFDTESGSGSTGDNRAGLPWKVYREMQKTVKRSELGIRRIIIYQDGQYYEKYFGMRRNKQE